MVVVTVQVDKKPVSFFVDTWLLETINKKWLPSIKKDDDSVICVDGAEGSGKSVFAFQLAKLLDPDFDLENVCLNAETFQKRIIEAKKGSCIVYDEAFTGLSSKSAISPINKALVEVMMEMRQKNLKVLIVLPTYFMLEKYVALFRTKCLFHIYRKRGARGWWMYFGKKKKKLLYLLGKKFLSYSKPYSDRRGKFPAAYTVNEAAYREKKANAFSKKERSTKESRFKRHRDILLWLLYDEFCLKSEQIADLLSHFGVDMTNDNITGELIRFRTDMQNENVNFPDKDFIKSFVATVILRNRPAVEEKRAEEAKKRMEREIRQAIEYQAKQEKKENKALPSEMEAYANEKI